MEQFQFLKCVYSGLLSGIKKSQN